LKLLLCDDQPLVRGGLHRIFEDAPDIAVVGEANNFPGMDGLELARTVTRRSRKAVPRVAFLTSVPDRGDVLSGLRAGGRGFLAKSDSPEEIVAGVRAVAEGHAVFSASLADVVLPCVSVSYRPCRRPESLNRLTEREIDVLRFMAEGLSNSEIAEALSVSQATVKSHVSRLLSKLDLRDRAQAIVAAYRMGLVRVESVRDGEIPRLVAADGGDTAGTAWNQEVQNGDAAMPR
jgi:DNA-binding NarL/FixJ family response regulator